MSPFRALSRDLRVHPVLKDLTVTATASLANFLASLLVISMFGRLLGATLLAEYLLLRRIAAWLQPLTHLGLGVGLPRFVAHSSSESRERQVEYFAAALLSILCFTAVMGTVFWFARRSLGTFLFGATEQSGLVIPLFLLLFGSAVQVAVYGLYRGRLEMNRAGMLQVCLALVPILSAATLFKRHSVALIVSSIGLSLLAVAILFAIPVLRESRNINIRELPARARELLQYGISRVPGDISTGALLAVGPVIATHYMPVSSVSFLLVATGMLLAVTVSTDPLGLVFLSKISMMLARGRVGEVQRYLSYLMSAIVDISIFVTIQMVVFADVLVRAWIGSELLEGITVIRIVLIGIPFYMFFTGLRSAVDAGTIRPMNARNVVLALGILLSLNALSVQFASSDFLLKAIALSLVFTFALLAYLTGRSLTSLFQITIQWRESIIPLSFSVLLGGVGLAYRSFSRDSILQLTVLELVFTGVFAAVCFYSQIRWTQQLWSMAFHCESSIPTPTDECPQFIVTSQQPLHIPQKLQSGS